MDGNVGILVGEKVEEGENGIEIDGVRVDLRPTGKDFELGVGKGWLEYLRQA